MRARCLTAWLLLVLFGGLYAAPVAAGLAPDEQCTCGCGRSKRECPCQRKTSEPGAPALFASDPCAETCGMHPGVLVTSHIAGTLPPGLCSSRPVLAAHPVASGAERHRPHFLTSPSLYQRPPPALP